MSTHAENQEELERNAPIQRELIYQGRTIALRSDRWQQHAWDIVLHPGAVVIVPITQEGKILMVRQWRRAVNKILIELPAGTLEENEAVASCAQRELQEETGYRSNELISLGGFYSAPGFCSEYLHLFLALQLEAAPLKPDSDEAIDVISMTVSEAWEQIKTQQICDAKTIAGVARYAQFQST
ncbi:MAG: NUDIX hydrolase [Rhabdochlamydiaceae bacterium]|nr:NUDIX hydrolase [Rhabdochlamydiaceae bacterium]